MALLYVSTSMNIETKLRLSSHRCSFKFKGIRHDGSDMHKSPRDSQVLVRGRIRNNPDRMTLHPRSIGFLRFQGRLPYKFRK